MRAIGSASVEGLTSESLQNLRDMIVAARRQRREVDEDLGEAGNYYRTKSGTRAPKVEPVPMTLQKAHRVARRGSAVTEAKVVRLADWSKRTQIKMDFEEAEAAGSAYATLVRAFSALAGSAGKWGVTSDRDANRYRERTVTNRTVERHSISSSLHRTT